MSTSDSFFLFDLVLFTFRYWLGPRVLAELERFTLGDDIFSALSLGEFVVTFLELINGTADLFFGAIREKVDSLDGVILQLL